MPCLSRQPCVWVCVCVGGWVWVWVWVCVRVRALDAYYNCPQWEVLYAKESERERPCSIRNNLTPHTHPSAPLRTLTLHNSPHHNSVGILFPVGDSPGEHGAAKTPLRQTEPPPCSTDLWRRARFGCACPHQLCGGRRLSVLCLPPRLPTNRRRSPPAADGRIPTAVGLQGTGGAQARGAGTVGTSSTCGWGGVARTRPLRPRLRVPLGLQECLCAFPSAPRKWIPRAHRKDDLTHTHARARVCARTHARTHTPGR